MKTAVYLRHYIHTLGAKIVLLDLRSLEEHGISEFDASIFYTDILGKLYSQQRAVTEVPDELIKSSRLFNVLNYTQRDPEL